MKLKWLSNILNPNHDNARVRYHFSPESFGNPARQEEEWRQYLNWINENVIGPPMATEHYTEQELRSMGLVGVYEKVEDERN